jgi:hypothetical protein
MENPAAGDVDTIAALSQSFRATIGVADDIRRRQFKQKSFSGMLQQGKCKKNVEISNI